MLDIVCGLLGDRAGAGAGTATGRARDLSVAWLRWHYFGEIIEDGDLAYILARAKATGLRYCLVQGYGHVIAEHAGPDGGKARGFFEALKQWISAHDFVFAGVPDRCLLVDLDAWSRAGEPRDCAPVPFGPVLDGHLIELGADLGNAAPFEAFLDEMCEKAGRGVFVLNYESYDDVAEAPPGFAAPVSTLYCVAAGLKPNRILATHGIGVHSRVVFFDYSADALDFRRRLDSDWDGYDYPRYIRALFAQGSSAHYYLWPGATPEHMDWGEFERLWAAELARWGGAEAFAAYWRAFQAIGHEYLVCNILAPETLLSCIEDAPGSVIWWSNAFSTIYSAAHHSLEEKRRIYAGWIAALAERAPGIFLYGSDHSNSSVNAITAEEYRARYFAEGGDPLSARAFHRQAIRF